MKYIILLTCLILTNGLFAQQLDFQEFQAITNSEVDKLLTPTDSVLIYQEGCVGCIIISEDNCNCIQTNYIIWNSNDQTFIKKIDCCSIHKTHMLEGNLWSDFSSNVEEIFNSNFELEWTINHDFFNNLIFKTANQERQIEIFDYYFSEELANSEDNKNQPAKIFIDKLGKIISNVEF